MEGMSMRRILITGAAGFIGYHLVKAAAGNGDSVTGVDNLNDYYDVNLKRARLAQLEKFGNFEFLQLDIADREAVSDLFRKGRFEVVVNLAAQAGVRYSLKILIPISTAISSVSPMCWKVADIIGSNISCLLHPARFTG